MLHNSQLMPIRRRDFLRLATLGGSVAFGGLLAACGGSVTTPTQGSVPATAPAVPTGTAAASASSGPAAGVTATVAPAATASRPVATASVGAAAATSPVATPSAMRGTPTSGGKLPAPAPNVPDAYTIPPAAFRSVATVPGRGGKISVTKASQLPPPTAHDRNSWWQELERRLGTTVDFTLIPLPQYTERTTAQIVAGNLSDLLLISPLSAPAQYRAVQQGAFTDLTGYLSGDALKGYPNLAAYPASAWRNSAINGKLYGVPRLSLAFGSALLYRQDRAQRLKLDSPQDAEAFLTLATAMSKNDPDGNGKADAWGLGAQGNDWSFGFVQGMYRVPNVWRKNADGTLTHAIETQEYRDALAFLRRLYEAGAYHPDAATFNRTQATNALIGGQIGGYYDQLLQLNGDIRTRFEAKRINPAANVAALTPSGVTGGRGVTYNGAGFGSIAAIPTTSGQDPEQIRALLRVLDYFSAPYFSDEYNFLTFGVDGVHNTPQPDGTRVLTERGKAEINELGTVVVPPRIFYYPSDPGDAQYLQGAARDIAALGIDNPALNAFSPTNTSKSAELNQLGLDRVTAIVTGRSPLTDLDTYIRDWRSRGGEQIRQEFQDSLNAGG